MFRMPSGSNKSRTSDFMITPKLARTPWASGFSSFRRLTVFSSDFVRAWKIMSKVGSRTIFVASASKPFPKKIIFCFFIV